MKLDLNPTPTYRDIQFLQRKSDEEISYIADKIE